MDAVRFLNFLQSFASSAASRLESQPASAGGLESALSDFESQLRTLLDQSPSNPANTEMSAASPQSEASTEMTPAAQVLAGAGRVAERQVFVTGGGGELAQASPPVGPVTTAQGVSDTSGSSDSSGAGAASAPLSALQKIVAWQREQIHPMLHVRVGDLWDRQGIADPLNHPGLLGQAQQIHDRANNFRSMMPGYVAAWEGEWQAPEAPLQVASRLPDPSGFVTEGQG